MDQILVEADSNHINQSPVGTLYIKKFWQIPQFLPEAINSEYQTLIILKMKPILITASGIVTLALIFYSLAFFGFHRKKKLTRKILTYQTAGLLLDIAATILMIIGSSKGPFTFHGILGYSSLSLMIVDTVFFWGRRQSEEFPPWLRTYSKVAYSWWILAYITGGMIAMLR